MNPALVLFSIYEIIQTRNNSRFDFVIRCRLFAYDLQFELISHYRKFNNTNTEYICLRPLIDNGHRGRRVEHNILLRKKQRISYGNEFKRENTQ